MILKPPRGTMLNKGHPITRMLHMAFLFNGGGGNTIYDSVRTVVPQTLTVHSDWVGGVDGPGLSHNADGDPFVNTGQTMGTSYTVAMRITPRTYVAGQRMWASNSSSSSLVSYNNCYNFYSVVGGFDLYPASAPITVNKTDDVTCVYDSAAGVARLYFNGQLAEEDTSVTDITNSDFALFSDSLGQYFQAEYAYCFVWKRALGAGEVASLHHDPYDMFRPMPIELWSASTQGVAAEAAGYMTLNTGYWG